jgi:hypothetical protein
MHSANFFTIFNAYRYMKSMTGDKQTMKEIDHVMTKLRALDATISEDLPDDQLQTILSGFLLLLSLHETYRFSAISLCGVFLPL